MKMLSRLLGVKNILMVLLLAFMFLNLGNYWYVAAIVPIAYFWAFKYQYRMLDTAFILLILFGLMYSVFAVASEVPLYVQMELVVIFPTMYLVGKSIGESESDAGVVNVIYILSVALAAMSIFSISESITEEGFLTEERAIEIEGSGVTAERSATGIYSNLMLLSMFLLSLFVKISAKKKFIYILGAVLAIYGSIRIQSRTSLVLLLVVLAIVLILHLKTMLSRNLWMVIISVLLIGGTYYYVTTTYEEELGLVERFQEDDTKTMGDRTLLAQNVVKHLPDHPLGGLEHMPYAHNLWLDTARVAGVVPFVLLVLATLIFVYYIVRIYVNRNHDFNYRFLMFSFALAFMIYMNTEPIIEGCSILFGLFCLFVGIVRGHDNVIEAKI